MSQKLHVGDFKWQYNETYNYKSEEWENSFKNYKRWFEDKTPFIIECNIHIPMDLRIKTKNLPFLPVNKNIKF